MTVTIELQIQPARGSSSRRAFQGDALVIGRADDVDIVVDEASVSRRHAKLFVRDGAWFVEDLQSRNGTRVNGVLVVGPTPIGPDDVIAVGDTVLRVAAQQDRPGRSVEVAWTAPSTSDDTVFAILKPASELLAAEGRVSAVERLRLLNDVHRALAAPVAREDLLRTILDRVFGVLQPEHSAIFLVGDDGCLSQAAERHSTGASEPLQLSRRLAEEVVRNGAAALVLDARADERFSDAASVLRLGTRSLVAAPLSDAEGCLGMIVLYSSSVAAPFADQDLELLVSLASAAALRLRNILLAEGAAERLVLDRELGLARDIQSGMLRRSPIDRAEASVHACVLPARLVGGDFYDYGVEDGALWFVVADVSGKGMAAALLMAMALSLFRALMSMGLPLAQVMARLNRELARDNDRAMFITAMAGRLSLDSGRLELVNAGHALPLRLEHTGVVRTIHARNALALGVLDEVTFPATELTLNQGDGLVFYTDGVCDAVDAAGEEFGIDRLHALLAGTARRGVLAIVETIVEAVSQFANGTPQEDDITVMAVRYVGIGASV